MAAVKETIETVKKIDVDQYKYGFETQVEAETFEPTVVRVDGANRPLAEQAPERPGPELPQARVTPLTLGAVHVGVRPSAPAGS